MHKAKPPIVRTYRGFAFYKRGTFKPIDFDRFKSCSTFFALYIKKYYLGEKIGYVKFYVGVKIFEKNETTSVKVKF